jgi:hypothetical protein
MYYKFQHVLNDLETHLNVGEPFSVVRVGDGDLKLLWELYKGRINHHKFRRNGIPKNKGDHILKIYKRGCNSATYTSSFEHYLTPQMWDRKFSQGTKGKVTDWLKIYNSIGVSNKEFCSPEIGFLFFMNGVQNNLFNLMKDKNVCVITCYEKVAKRLRSAKINAHTFVIPGIGKGHYNVYQKNVERLRAKVSKNEHDLYLMSAGALGKGYSYHIKDAGGITVDIGQVAKFWVNGRIAERFRGILTKADGYTFKFTKNGEKFRKFL